MITVLLAEDRSLVREAWRVILKKDTRFRVIAECGSPESALLQARRLQPDIVILEIRPPGLTGIELVQMMRKFSPDTKILGVSLYSIPNIARELILAGASGYLTKTSPLEEMLEAIMTIHEGEHYVCREVKKAAKENTEATDDPLVRLSRLSVREIEVIVGIKNGLTSKEIAEGLRITGITVDVHRDHILKKLKLEEASDLVELLDKHHS